MVHFILGEIAEGRVALTGDWCVTALSMESPVINALRGVVHEMGGSEDLRINIVLMRPGHHIVENCFGSVGALAVRTSTNSRLLDAHEQLVLGPTSSWTGDCMRRDPRERDAFETFGSDNAELSEWALKSFARLWLGARPILVEERRAAAAREEVAVDGVVVGDGTGQSAVVAATSRH